MGSLQDQLLKVGLIDEQKVEKLKKEKLANRQNKKAFKKAAKKGKPASKDTSKPQSKPKPKHESDLAAAYAAKQKAEKQDKEYQKQQRMAEMERRRLRNLQLDKLVEDKLQNDDSAEMPRYFNYMGKIRRILLTEEQLKAVDQGELVIVVHRSRPGLLDKETAEEFKKLAPDLVPDTGGEEPDGKEWDDQYAGFEVPDDLRW